MTMTPALTAAAERLVSLPGFRWMPGMLVARDGHRPRYIRTYDDCVMHFACEVFAESMDIMRDGAKRLLPDLTDPATLGCVLAMVREVWKRPGIHVRVIRPIQGLHKNKDTFYQAWDEFAGVLVERAPTEAECLVNALAAAAGAK